MASGCPAARCALSYARRRHSDTARPRHQAPPLPAAASLAPAELIRFAVLVFGAIKRPRLSQRRRTSSPCVLRVAVKRPASSYLNSLSFPSAPACFTGRPRSFHLSDSVQPSGRSRHRTPCGVVAVASLFTVGGCLSHQPAQRMITVLCHTARTVRRTHHLPGLVVLGSGCSRRHRLLPQPDQTRPDAAAWSAPSGPPRASARDVRRTRTGWRCRQLR